MDILIIIALVIAIPVILFPAAFVWYLNISGILTVLKHSVIKHRVREARRKAVHA